MRRKKKKSIITCTYPQPLPEPLPEFLLFLPHLEIWEGGRGGKGVNSALLEEAE